jgi:hypothetical protein
MCHAGIFCADSARRLEAKASMIASNGSREPRRVLYGESERKNQGKTEAQAEKRQIHVQNGKEKQPKTTLQRAGSRQQRSGQSVRIHFSKSGSEDATAVPD